MNAGRRPDLRLRPATGADAGAVAAIWQREWADGHLGHVPDALVARRRPEHVAALVPPRIPHTTVAVLDEVVVGFVTVQGDEVEEVYVDGAARGTGVAGALLTHGEAEVAARHAVAWLAVVEGNARARRFYEREGWVDAGPLAYEAPHPDGGTIPVPVRRYEKRVR